jgi:hypothetical protein
MSVGALLQNFWTQESSENVVIIYGVSAATLVVVQMLGTRVMAGQAPFRRWPYVDAWICRYLTYWRVLRRHKHTRPWSMAECACLLWYVGSIVTVGVICRVRKGDTTKSLASFLAVNMIPLYFGHTHDFPAGALGLSLQQYGRMHRVVAGGCFGLATVHAGLAWKAIDRSDLAWSYWTWVLLVRVSSTGVASDILSPRPMWWC